jgi:hypothetical protein
MGKSTIGTVWVVLLLLLEKREAFKEINPREPW